MRIWGPERSGGQGLDDDQHESGARAIHHLLTAPECRELVDLVITWRADAEGGAYEVWARRGMRRFRRVLREDGGFDYPLLEVRGVDPLANQDELALATLADEREAARAGGFADQPWSQRFVAPAQQSYPFACERIAQLFDSPNAPDLAISPVDWAQGPYAGNHGALHVRQARAPLWLRGPGIRPGHYDRALREVDVAPTLLAACGFPKIDGADHSGRLASERGAAPDVYLARQDGAPCAELLDPASGPAQRAYLFLLDGLHLTELDERLASEPARYPNLLRLREGAAILAGGQIVNFPSITWPSHTTLATGCWGGHHDVVNPSWYERSRGETLSPQGQQVRTEGFCNSRVESIYEAFERRYGSEAWTAAIHAPFGRGATHAVLEGRNTSRRSLVKALTLDFAADCDPRWTQEGLRPVSDESVLDTRGLAQVVELFTSEEHPPPRFVYHELVLTDGVGHHHGPHGDGIAAALAESDRRIGRVLDLLEGLGLADETLFVLTADHGMAPQDRSVTTSPLRTLEQAGLACAVMEPMLWLHDLRVEVERAPDGRTGRVRVLRNDRNSSGEPPPIEGARIDVERHRAGERPAVVARGRSGPDGYFGFPTPPDAASESLLLAVHAEGFNARHLRLDGTSLLLDVGALLYGAGGGLDG